MDTLNTDVLVVGAGPAGCLLSNLLARSGVDVTLVEQHKTFDREFRGNAFQPSVLRILDRMGLPRLLEELDHERVQAFGIHDHTGCLLDLRLDELRPPYNYAVITPQPPLLKRLVQEAGRYPNFRFVGDCAVQGVVMEGGAVAGVMAHLRGQPWMIRSRLVVAADGRFSAIRRDLGIGLSRSVQEFDFVWFDMPREIPWQSELGLTLEKDGILINIPKERGTSQVGWVIPKGGFARLRQAGLQKFYERVRRVDPELGEVLPNHLKRFDQCALLDVKVGEAEEWARDGLLLIGDAAHIASPVGGQGNKLAVEDAALVHPVIVSALKSTQGRLPASAFSGYVAERRHDVGRILCLQNFIGRMVIGPKNPLVRGLRGWLLGVMDRPFIKRRIAATLALGPRPVDVDTSCFNHRDNEDPLKVFHPLKVRTIVQETLRARTVVLEVPENLREVFRYQPGQFVTVRVLNRGVLARRCYSLTGDPADAATLSITVKWIVNGNVSTSLVKELKEGDTLWVHPPRGTFVHQVDAASRRHHVMFAAGSGITPVYSILKSVLAREPESRVSLFYGNHDEGSIIFKQALDDLAAREPERFHLRHVLQRFDEAFLNETLEAVRQESPSGCEYYVCGPEGMMDEVLRVLKKNKAPASKTHFEKFVSLYSEEERVEEAPGAEGVEVGDPPTGGTVIPEKLRVKINGSVSEVPIRKGETLLQAALRAGLPAPYSCESGVCATCTGRLNEGRVRMEHYDALTERDMKRNNILACQAVQMTREAFIDFDVL